MSTGLIIASVAAALLGFFFVYVYFRFWSGYRGRKERLVRRRGLERGSSCRDGCCRCRCRCHGWDVETGAGGIVVGEWDSRAAKEEERREMRCVEGHRGGVKREKEGGGGGGGGEKEEGTVTKEGKGEEEEGEWGSGDAVSSLSSAGNRERAQGGGLDGTLEGTVSLMSSSSAAKTTKTTTGDNDDDDDSFNLRAGSRLFLALPAPTVTVTPRRRRRCPTTQHRHRSRKRKRDRAPWMASLRLGRCGEDSRPAVALPSASEYPCPGNPFADDSVCGLGGGEQGASSR